MDEQMEFDFNEGECLREGFKLTFSQLQERVHDLAKRNGFWDCLHHMDNHELVVPAKLMLIASEVAEAMEADRNNMPAAAVHEELADIVIRCMDLAQALNCDLGKVIYEKHLVNLARPYKHSKRY